VTPSGKGFIQNIETNHFKVGKKNYAIIWMGILVVESRIWDEGSRTDKRTVLKTLQNIRT